MRDIRETDGSYELDEDLPGFKKDEIKVQLKDGYLTLAAAKGLDKDEKDKEGNYIRRERYAGTLSRSTGVRAGCMMSGATRAPHRESCRLRLRQLRAEAAC